MKCDRLAVWYGQVVALADVSFAVEPGVTGLLGPNGAGKTSLIRIATGQLKPRTGALTLDGQAPWRNGALLARVGYAPEGDAFWPGLSGTAFVEALLGLSGYARKDRRRLAAAAIERVGLDASAAARPVTTYSKGMKQRIKLAAATAHDPDFLFLDEPFEGADPVGRKALMDMVRALGDAGKTVLLSSHVLHEVERLADRVVVLRRGKVLATGSLAEIRAALDSHPIELRVAGSGIRALASELAACEHVQQLAFEAGALRVRTRDPDACFEAIGAFGARAGGVERLSCTDDNLEAVFHYLAGGAS